MKFYKMHGCGNDFLFVDAMKGPPVELNAQQVEYWCDRHFGIGADGIAIFTPGTKSDVKWNFYNSDGSRAEMCGNAARCAIRFLADKYFPGKKKISIETLSGVIEGRAVGEEDVEIALAGEAQTDYEERVIHAEDMTLEVFFLNTGVPHAVIEVKDLMTYPISRVGRVIQAHPAFQPEGTNVTYFQKVGEHRILSTTFERGVEAETFACGTGACAAAIVYSERYLQKFPIEVSVPGGLLTVDLESETKRVLLRGPAQYVFEVEVADTGTNFSAPKLYGDRKGRK